MSYKPRTPKGPPIPPDVLAARLAAETVERELVFGICKSYNFFQRVRNIICPWNPDTLSYRRDFSVDRYNYLYASVANFYCRFDGKRVPPGFRLPNTALKNVIIDQANGNLIAADTADQILAEIDEEAQFTENLTNESLAALVDSPGFADWLKSRVLEHTVGKINSMRGAGKLTIEGVEILLEAGLAAIDTISPRELARPIGGFNRPPDDDESILIGPGRFLCRGGICTITGPSGIGKSTMVMQMSLGFATGREVFGFKPNRNLKLVVIQGENDDGDIAEMRDGILDGLNIPECERAGTCQNIMVVRSNGDTGRQFFEKVVRPNLRHHKPDLLVIDPALAFIGGDSKEQSVVGEFLRTHLMKILADFSCACLLVHHTNKPPANQGRVTWSGGDSYLEGGSAEFRNAARAAITLLPLSDSGIFELSVPKRGRRLGWMNDDGQPIIKRFIKQSQKSRLFWELATGADAERAKVQQAQRKQEEVNESVFACLPTSGEISQKRFLEKAKSRDIGETNARKALKVLVDAGRITPATKKRKGSRGEIFYSRAEVTSMPGGGK